MSTSYKFCERFLSDGQNWTDLNGIDWSEAMKEYPHRVSPIDRTPCRYTFRDGSVIVEWEGAWDVGFEDVDCTCGTSEGHANECKHSPHYEPEVDYS